MSPFRRSVRPNSVMFAANYEDGRTALRFELRL